MSRFQGALQPRIIGRAEDVPERALIALFLEDGGAEIRTDPPTAAVHAPGLLWHPMTPGFRVLLQAGAAGYYAILDAATLDGAFGHDHAAQGLRDLAQMPLDLPAPRGSRIFGSLKHAFSEIHDIAEETGLAGRMLLETHLRIVLLELARMRDLTLIPAASGASSKQILERFKALVEAHYRERLTVQSIANTLGVSADRLYDICLREHHTTPKKLIDKRIGMEAAKMLQGSAFSVEQIADQLGFASASQFTRFFRRVSGVPPGKFRRQIATPRAPEAFNTNLYEWP